MRVGFGDRRGGRVVLGIELQAISNVVPRGNNNAYRGDLGYSWDPV